MVGNIQQLESPWDPGIDSIANLWIKHLTALNEDLNDGYKTCIANPEECPNWLTTGITYPLPKTGDTANPNNYSPISCLPTMYRILTSILSVRCYSHLVNNNLLPSEQKGYRKGSYGCKYQLLINKVILEDMKTRKKNLSTAWVDYNKAFDSVPHS